MNKRVSNKHVLALTAMSSQHPFGSKLKKILGRALPNGLGNILLESGFDSECALSTIDLVAIKSIEEYVNNNKHLLEGTVYENQNVDFKFKPGHRLILLGLPKALAEYEAKKPKNDKKNAEKIDEEEEEKRLKESLVKKLNNFVGKFQFDLNFSFDLISEFRRDLAQYRVEFFHSILFLNFQKNCVMPFSLKNKTID